LPEGESIEGWIQVDGLQPRAPMQLRWSGAGIEGHGFAALPAPVRNALRETSIGDGLALATTDARGNFALRGLNAGNSGRLYWEEPYWLRDERSGAEHQFVRLSVPQHNLELQLRESVELRLRIVDSAGAAVPNALVFVRTLGLNESSAHLADRGSSADEQGRARLALAPANIEAVEARVLLADRGGEALHHLGAPDRLRGVWDVGDLAVSPTRTMSVSVVDESGAPVESAYVWAVPSEGEGVALSAESKGRFRISPLITDTAIGAHALGYELTLAAIAPDQEHVTVKLRRFCQLEFLVKNYAGNAGYLRVSLRGTAPIFASESPNFQAIRDSTWVSANREGRWIAAGLRHDQPLLASLYYRGARVLAEVQIDALALGESRSVTLEVQEPPLHLRVLVCDASAAPLLHAQVQSRSAVGSWSASRAVDEKGAALISGIYAQPVTLLAQAPGFAAKIVHGVPIPPEEFTLVLETPRSIELELLCPNGSPCLEKCAVTAQFGAPRVLEGTALGEGRWRLEGLPSGEIELMVSGKFGLLTALHDSAVPSCSLVVGEPGRLLVKLSCTGETRFQEWSIALASLGSTPVRRRMAFFFDRESRASVAFGGLALGSYEVWLETRGGPAGGGWSRIGPSATVALEKTQPAREVELRR
jgi:hypothetical protein